MPLREIDTNPREIESNPATDADAKVMLRATITLFAKWGITDEDAAILLDLPVRTYRRWKAGQPGRMGRDTMARMSNLLGIHSALRSVFADPQRGYDWIRAENAAFGEMSALETMLGGELTDLMRVRRYLDAEQDGW